MHSRPTGECITCLEMMVTARFTGGITCLLTATSCGNGRSSSAISLALARKTECYRSKARTECGPSGLASAVRGSDSGELLHPQAALAKAQPRVTRGGAMLLGRAVPCG